MMRLRLGRLLLLLVSTGVSLGAAELVYRAYLNRAFRKQVATFPSSAWNLLPDSPREFSLPPNRIGKMVFEVDPTRSVPYRTNSGGFRDRGIGVKLSEVPRVAVLGVSYTFGWGA